LQDGSCGYKLEEAQVDMSGPADSMGNEAETEAGRIHRILSPIFFRNQLAYKKPVESPLSCHTWGVKARIVDLWSFASFLSLL
jgi:hypothetical protein